MSKKVTLTAATLLRQLATIINQQSTDCRRRLRQLELAKTKADKRLAKLESRNERLAKKVSRHTKTDRPRQRQRHVRHNLTPIQKAKLLQAWDKYHADDAALDRQSYALAKGLDLHRERQVLKWFKIFNNMSAASRKLLRRKMIKALAKKAKN